MALIPKNLKEFKLHFKDPLFKNSYFILLILGSISIFGLVFLVIITRYYSPDNVGFASALQSISQLISSFSILGLNYGMIRFFPQRDDRNEMVNTSFSLVGLSSIIISIFIINLFDHYFWTSYSGLMISFLVLFINIENLQNFS